MRTKSKEPQRQYLLAQHKIIDEKIQNQGEPDIYNTRKAISKKLQSHVFAKWWIEKVDNTANMTTDGYEFLSHSGNFG
jgi:hypothetical protein